MKKTASMLPLALLVAAAFPAPAAAADPASINWSRVPARTVTLFYPAHPGDQAEVSVQRSCWENAVAKLSTAFQFV
jgi:hypothetical protein